MKLNKRKKILIGVLTPIVAVVLCFAALCFVTIGMFSSEYLGRVLTHFDSDVSDYKYFPERVVEAGDNHYEYNVNIDTALADLAVEYSNGKKTVEKNLSAFIEETDTTSFIVVKNDAVIYEQYANGYDENSVNTSFSMAKSVVSLLVGKAIEEGYIKSVNQPIADYIEEFAGKEIGNITIESLLSMRSGIEYDEDKLLWFGDDSLTYWYPDLRELALTRTKLTNKYQGKFHYNNFHPLLLGIILERSTGISVSEYFAKTIWQPIGAEYDASWSLDSKNSGFEKMESGINFRAIDFVKIGSMVLHNGEFNGRKIIDKDWLDVSTVSELPLNADDYKDTFLESRNVGYKYMWYTYCTDDGYDIIAWGKSDQILYISPSEDTVILRTGRTDGGVAHWENVLKNISRKISTPFYG